MQPNKMDTDSAFQQWNEQLCLLFNKHIIESMITYNDLLTVRNK